MKKLIFLVLSSTVFLPLTNVAQNNKKMLAKDYKLVWSDEFNKDGRPDEKIWSYEQGFVRNEELQWYQPDNAYCKGGKLIIEAREQEVKNNDYNPDSKNWKNSREKAKITSACLITKGKKEFLYGRFEVRAKIPLESGSWPAIWTLGIDMPWPSCGEIDLMEYYRIDGVPHILANAAWGSDRPNIANWDSVKLPFKHFTDKDPNWRNKFHIWRMDWDEKAIKLYLDDELLNEILLSETVNELDGKSLNPFKQPHFLLLNLAVGGEHGGQPSMQNFPLKYEIDYVRVYKKNKRD
jgi:beta-glucanase (GH16 family)